MAAHPHCPCTRASIESLARIMTRCRGLVTAHVAFCKPAGFPGDWEQTDLWRSAAAIPDVEVFCDEEGREARRFGAATSGCVLLFSPAENCSSVEGLPSLAATRATTPAGTP